MRANREPNGQKRPGVIQRFRAELAREDLSMTSAAFSDRELEAAYQRHLVEVDLPKIKMVALCGVVFWYLFGILDVLTIHENLTDIIILRTLITGPVVFAIAMLMFNERMKQYYGLLTAIGMGVFGVSMLAIIHMMPATGAPPYIIGVLVIFVYASCFTRIRFPLAASLYLLTAGAYSLMLNFGAKYSDVDVISGQFFMVTIASFAVLTHYAQEIRSRQIWRRNRQRALDAAYIEELLIEATAADQSKINFISILSHELRTPLHQIIGFSEVVRGRLSERADAAEAQEFVEDINASARDLLSRIAKMLRYADATAGKINYEKEETAASDLVETVLVPMRDKAEARKIALDTADLAEADIYMDHHHTSYALSHLVENAIKASPAGSTVRLIGRPEADGGYALEIADTGEGMDESQIKAAFEPFTQVEQVRTRSRDGLGLGLTLARKIFLDQGAEMTIDSARGRGTSIRVRFPPRPARKAAAPAGAA